MRFNTILLFLLLGSQFLTAQQKINPGEIWNDIKGEQINAHGGCVVFEKGYYYWFGEDRTGMVSNGVSCYRSQNLYDWERVGLILPTTGDFTEDLQDVGKGRLIERPKVFFNAQTKKWILWGHWEAGDGYGAARVVVAQSDNVEGPYQFYKTFRPNKHDSRDQTVFVDDDGKAYHFGSVDMNTNMNIALLREDYLEPTETEIKTLLGRKYEAPAIFKKGDVYFGLFSGSTGWNPNPGMSAYTYDILTQWTESANFAVDRLKDLTYKSQSTYVFKVEGLEDAYVYMGDRWNPNDVGKSHYVWLPISLRSGYPTVRWYDNWDLSVFKDMYRYKRAKSIAVSNTYTLLEKNSNRLVSKSTHGFTLEDDQDELNLSLVFEKGTGEHVYRLKDAKSGQYLESIFGTLRLNKQNTATTQEWKFELQPNGYYKISNVADQKYLSVSGGSTFSGTGLYLAPHSPKAPQEFGVYFDSKSFKYEAADIFSKEYPAFIARQIKQ